jgi:hypothetical protein
MAKKETLVKSGLVKTPTEVVQPVAPKDAPVVEAPKVAPWTGHTTRAYKTK